MVCIARNAESCHEAIVMVVHEVVITTTSGATIDDKDGIMTSLDVHVCHFHSVPHLFSSIYIMGLLPDT